LSYLVKALEVGASVGRDVQIGGPDVLTYAEMLDRMAEVLGLPHRLRVPVPLITPWLSSLWIGLVTPVDPGVARPLIEGLAVPTAVSDPAGMELFDLERVGFEEALRRAVAAEPRAGGRMRLLGRLFASRAARIGIVVVWLVFGGLGGSFAQRFQDILRARGLTVKVSGPAGFSRRDAVNVFASINGTLLSRCPAC